MLEPIANWEDPQAVDNGYLCLAAAAEIAQLNGMYRSTFLEWAGEVWNELSDATPDGL